EAHGRRMVLLDHMGPAIVTEASGLDGGPHWYVGVADGYLVGRGQVLRRVASDPNGHQTRPAHPDDLRSRGRATPRRGHGPPPERPARPAAWVTLSERTTHGPPAFDPYAALPQDDTGVAVATVSAGTTSWSASSSRHPARRSRPRDPAPPQLAATDRLRLRP